MPGRRPRQTPTEDWAQLELRFTDASQRLYEVIRPIALNGQPVAERAEQTGVPERTIYRALQLFEEGGLAGLLTPKATNRGRPGSPALETAIAQLKAEYPAFRPYQIGTICFVRFGVRPSPQTIASVLRRVVPAAPVTRRYPPYATIATPRQRRLAVIHLHAEGWTPGCIAGYLQVHRDTVHDTLCRWKETVFADLDDRAHDRHRHSLKVTLEAMEEARQRQVENPLLGEFRMFAALKAIGIDLSPRTCGRILALNRQLYGLIGPSPLPPSTPLPMPFKASWPHQYWTVDLRYLDHMLGDNVYCISILENFSRAMVASMLSRTQDTAAYLLVLRTAIERYGSPEALISDSGGVFLSSQAMAVYQALNISKQQIERGEPWQSYIESNFNVQRRIGDHAFARASTWEALVAAHDRWMQAHNRQTHWAHRARTDGRHSPLEVLSWVQGTTYSADRLEAVFAELRSRRRLDRHGYVRFRHWRLYGERGLARQAAVLWLSKEHLTIAFGEDPLAQYVVQRSETTPELRSITPLFLLDTRHRSPQPFLWEQSPDEWLSVIRVPARPSRRRRHEEAVQQPLLLPAPADPSAR